MNAVIYCHTNDKITAVKQALTAASDRHFLNALYVFLIGS